MKAAQGREDVGGIWQGRQDSNPRPAVLEFCLGRSLTSALYLKRASCVPYRPPFFAWVAVKVAVKPPPMRPGPGPRRRRRMDTGAVTANLRERLT